MTNCLVFLQVQHPENDMILVQFVIFRHLCLHHAAVQHILCEDPVTMCDRTGYTNPGPT